MSSHYTATFQYTKNIPHIHALENTFRTSAEHYKQQEDMHIEDNI